MAFNFQKRIALWGQLFNLDKVENGKAVYIGEDTGVKVVISEDRFKEYEATDQLQRSWEV